MQLLLENSDLLVFFIINGDEQMNLTDIECNEPDSKDIQSIILSLDCEFAHGECPAPPQFLGGLLCLLASGEGTTHSTCSLAAEIQGLVFLIL